MKTFLGIDGELSEQATNVWFRFVSAWPLWLVLFSLSVVVLLVLHLYRREGVRLPIRDVLIFTALRVTALTILLVMIFEPVLVWDVPTERSSSLLFVLDDSQSMSISDRYDGSDGLAHVVRLMWTEMSDYDGTSVEELSSSQQAELAEVKRADLVNRALSSDGGKLLRDLSKEFNLQVFAASENLQLLGSSDQQSQSGQPMTVVVEAKGAVSRLGDLVREAVSRNRGRVAAVVLVGDGVVNAGEDYDSLGRYLARREIPAYGVGVGDSRQPRDLRIRSAEANRVALVDDIVSVNVALESTGFRGRTAEIELLRDGEAVPVVYRGSESNAARVLLVEETIEQEGKTVPKAQSVTFSFRADREGTFTYTVSAKPRPEELVTDNNSVDMPIRVLNERIKVLYVEGPPRWEYRYLKNALTRDPTIDLSCVLASADFEFAQEGNLPISYFPAKEEDLFAYDVIIVGDLPRNQLTEDQRKSIVKLVEKIGGGLLMIAGEGHAPAEYRNSAFEKMLPVDLDRRGLAADAFEQVRRSKAWQPVLTAEGQVSPMTRFVGDTEVNKRMWADLPGMFWHYPIARAKPGAQVLLVHPFARSSYGLHPLLAVQYYGSGKCAFMAMDSTWRWRDRVGDKYQAKFWGQIVRDLSQNRLIGKSKRFRIATNKSQYRLGEKVGIFAQLLDEKFEPSRKSSVDVQVEVPGLDRITLTLSGSVGEPGRYRGEFTPPASGQYHLKLLITEVGLPEEAVSHSFLVRPSMLEFQDVSMNQVGQKRLGEQTGGGYFHIDELPDLAGSILALKASSVREVNDELWNAPLLFVVFSLLFVTELIYRKRRRLL